MCDSLQVTQTFHTKESRSRAPKHDKIWLCPPALHCIRDNKLIRAIARVSTGNLVQHTWQHQLHPYISQHTHM